MTAIAIPPQLPVPIFQETDGRLVVGDSRFPLERIIESHEQGLTPHDIIDCFDTLLLEDVYTVIAYYLHHRDEVNDYLIQQNQRAEIVQAEAEAICPPRPEHLSELHRRWAEIRKAEVPAR